MSDLFDVSQMSDFSGPVWCLHHPVITRTAIENEWVVYLCVVVVYIQMRLVLLDWQSFMRLEIRTVAYKGENNYF